jgi:methyl-accepting chemotaxis protein
MKNSFTPYKRLAGPVLAALGLGWILLASGVWFWIAALLCGCGICLAAAELSGIRLAGVGSGYGSSDQKALEHIFSVVSQAAAGNLNTRVVLLPAAQDIITKCARKLNDLLDLTEVFCKEADTAMQFATQRKYFRKIILTGMVGDFARHSQTINQTLDNMRERDLASLDFAEKEVSVLVGTAKGMAATMKRNALCMAEDSQTTAMNSTSVAKGAEETSRSVQTVAAAAEELCGSFAEVGRQATMAKDATTSAVKLAASRQNDVIQLRRLAESISQTTALIDNIAQQTNLLALNASIEAAHAGAQGKGFAVVAQEIKLLANQTAKATGDITSVISGIQQMVEQMTSGIGELSSTMKEIEDISISVAGSVEEQILVTKDITRNMVEVSQSSDQIAASINDVRSIADSCEHKTHDVMTAIMDLEDLTATLEDKLNSFIKNIDFRKKPKKAA